MEISSICRYCGGKIIKSTTRALYPKGREPIYLGEVHGITEPGQHLAVN